MSNNSAWLVSINIKSDEPKKDLENIINLMMGDFNTDGVIVSVDIIEDFSDDFDPWFNDDDDDFLAGV